MGVYARMPSTISPAVGRVGVLAVEGGDTNRAARKKGGIHEFRNIGHALHSAHGMAQRDQPVRLTATVRGIEPKNRRDLTAGSRETPEHIRKQIL